MAKKQWVPAAGTTGPSRRGELLTDQAVALAGYGAEALVAAGRLRVKSKPAAGLTLPAADRAALAQLPAASASVRKKLGRAGAALTVADVAALTMAIAEAFPNAGPRQQAALLGVAGRLMACLQTNLVMPDEPAAAPRSKSTDRLYRVKVTLLGTKPPVWRRVEVRDCTLDQLHAHVQAAMGWENSHLHHFRVGDRYYGDPDLMADNFEEFGYEDSTATVLSDLVPAGRKKLKLLYEYDFGDSWAHELVVEAAGPPEAGVKYPVCVGGGRACPPEDVGGVWGYADFLDAVRDPDHEQHEDMLEWAGGPFDPDEFDLAAATRRMRRGLPGGRRT